MVDSVMVADSTKSVQINSLQFKIDSLEKVKSYIKKTGKNTFTIGE
jgi:hypothetical protein